MRTTIAGLMLVSLVGVTSAIKCWDTKGQFYAMRSTNTIDMKTCDGSKSCMKEWYKASPTDLPPLVLILSSAGRLLG